MNVLPRIIRFSALPILSASMLGSGVFAQNLLVNGDFKQGEPGATDFGWTVDLAKDQASECTVVEGRTPGCTAIV